MNYLRGAVVTADDPFGRTPRRPYLIVSDDQHPFAGKQSLATGITTSDYEEAIPIAGWITKGELTREADSQAAPWAVVTLKNSNINKQVAQIEPSLVNTIVHAAIEYLGLDA
jgi:mRNA interferase MazF